MFPSTITQKLAASSIVLATLATAPLTRAADIKPNINWQKFLARQDLTWAKLPANWNEAAFLGNGLLGENLYTTDDGHYLQFAIGRSDVVYKEARMPIGDMVLKTAGTITSGNLRLDLWNAEAVGEITTTKGHIKFRAFTHANQMIDIVQITPDDGEKNCSWQFVPGNAQLIPRKGAKPIPEEDKNPDPILGTDRNNHFALQPFTTGGGDATVWTEKQNPGGSSTLYLSVGYSTKEADAAKLEADAAVATAIKSSAEQLADSHRDWWHHYYPESFVSLPDPRLESFYWIQMYKLASATRADREVIDLMGPWYRTTPWPRIWWNLNIQLTYWPIYTANRLELGEPFCKILDDHKEQLNKNTKPHLDDGYAIGRSCSYDLARSALPEVSNLTWALHNYWLQYAYSMDEPMLRDRLYPLLKGSVAYTVSLMEKGPDGKLHITKGLSPEYPGQPSPDPDTNYDLALVRWGLQTLIASSDHLHLNDPMVPQWKQTLADLVDYPTDDTGFKISASVADKESHRHYSHLMMIYPLHLLTPDQPENLPLIQKSIDHWTSMPNAFRGFSYTGASSFSSLLGKGNDALDWLNKWFDTTSKFKVTPNTMYVEAGPVIESPLSGAAAVNDMLLQSWGGKLRVFPAIPDAWKDVTFQNLRGEGAFLVTAARKNGKTTFIQIQSLAGQPCKLLTDMENPFPMGMAGVGGQLPVKLLAPHEYEVTLKKGDTMLLTPGGRNTDTNIAPVETDRSKWNYWGVK
ncbi:MAG: glycosyl hydrolase family 95 catalytic domain-containing protein [Phycisphaerae bacterium]